MGIGNRERWRKRCWCERRSLKQELNCFNLERFITDPQPNLPRMREALSERIHAEDRCRVRMCSRAERCSHRFTFLTYFHVSYGLVISFLQIFIKLLRWIRSVPKFCFHLRFFGPFFRFSFRYKSRKPEKWTVYP